MNNFKLGVGPMSHDINHILDLYAEKTPLLVVASRNQVDYNSGYVCRSEELPSFFSMRSNILLCRDHCGPYFKDSDKGLTVDEAIEECKKTIDADIKAGFDLIHIDVSRIPENQFHYAKILIDYALSKNEHIMFEFGSENNTGKDLAPSAARITEQLEFISQYKRNVKFFVTQTGSFTQHTQTGAFDVQTNSHLVEKVKSYGFRFKEHNADYLLADDVKLRSEAGIDALNIAPQLGTIQTRVTKSLSGNSEQWNNFAKVVYDSGLWKKWMPDDMVDDDLAIIVAGHYHFNTPEYKALVNSIDSYKFKNELKKEIFNVLDVYTGNLL